MVLFKLSYMFFYHNDFYKLFIFSRVMIGLIGLLGALQTASPPIQMPREEPIQTTVDSSAEYAIQIEYYIKRVSRSTDFYTESGHARCWEKTLLGEEGYLEVKFCSGAFDGKTISRFLEMLQTDSDSTRAVSYDRGARGYASSCGQAKGEKPALENNPWCNEYYGPFLLPVRNILKDECEALEIVRRVLPKEQK